MKAPTLFYEFLNFWKEERFDVLEWHYELDDAHGVRPNFVLLVFEADTLGSEVGSVSRNGDKSVLSEEEIILEILFCHLAVVRSNIAHDALLEDGLQFFYLQRVHGLGQRLASSFVDIDMIVDSRSVCSSQIGVAKDCIGEILLTLVCLFEAQLVVESWSILWLLSRHSFVHFFLHAYQEIHVAFAIEVDELLCLVQTAAIVGSLLVALFCTGGGEA